MASGGPLSHARGDAGTLMAFLPLAGAGTSAPVPARQVMHAAAPDTRAQQAVAPVRRASPLRRLARRAVRSARRWRDGK
jgi:hypothetical protein